MSIKATKDNAKFISKVYTQEASDTNWAKAKPKVKFKYKEANVLDNSTTSELVINKRISEGDIIVVNDNGIKKKILKGSDILQIGGLVDNPDPFGDGSGIDLWQLDGNANSATGQYNGTWYGNEQYDVGVFGQAAKFDGNSYIKLHEYSVPITISFWAKNVNGDNIRCFVQDNMHDNGDNWNINIASDGKIYFNGGYTDAHSNDSIENISEFNHIVLGFPDNNVHNMKFYINGVNAGSVVTNDEQNNIRFTSFIYLGKSRNGKALDGTYIDQVRFFNKALTEDEVQKLYIEEVSKFNISDLNLSQTPQKIWLIDGSIITPKDSSTTTQLVFPANSVKAFDTLILNDGTEKEIVVRSVERDSDGNDIVQIGQELALVPSEVAKVDVPEVIVDVEPTEQELLVDDIELEKESSTKTQFAGTSIKNIPISSGMEVILDNKVVVTSDVIIENIGLVDNPDPFGDNSGVALWKFDGNANDAGGNYDGVESDNITYTQGVFGRALDSGWITFNNSDFFENQNYNRTVSLWIKHIESNDEELIFEFAKAGTHDHRFYLMKRNDNSYIFAIENSFYDFNIDKNVFTHIAIVTREDKSGVDIYINGKRKSFNISFDEYDFSDATCHIIGASNNPDNRREYTGLIDQVRIFNRALTDEEVQTLYKYELKHKYTLEFPEQPQAPQTCLVPAKGKRVKLTPFQMSYDESSNTLLKEAQEFEKIGRALQYAIKSPKDIEISQLNIDLWKKQ